ncbi:unnamed protein product [marine sediment metagenome]|uniref:Uncharacterized protein n=1 Tax=marine sediment metagenome TaxID=412755 RepID=X1DII9_9ZZZZ
MLNKMGEFMDAHIIKYLIGGKEQTGGDIDISFSRAASPVGFIIFERDIADSLPEQGVVEF